MAAFDEATTAARERRAQTLNLLAQHGEAGRQMVRDAATRNSDHGRDVIGAALDDADTFGAPKAMKRDVSATVNDANSILAAAAQSSEGSMQRDLQRQRQGAYDYSLSAQRAIPVVQAQADRDIGYAKAQWDQNEERQAADEAFQREQRDWAREQHGWAMEDRNRLSTAEQEVRALGAANQQAEADQQQQMIDSQNAAIYLEGVQRAAQAGRTQALGNDYGGPAARATLSANQADHLSMNARSAPGAKSGPVGPLGPMSAGGPVQRLTTADLGLDDNAASLGVLRDARSKYDEAEQRYALMQQQWEQSQATPMVQSRNAAISGGMDPQHAYGTFFDKPMTSEDMLSSAQNDSELDFWQQTGITNPTPQQLQAFQQGQDPFAQHQMPNIGQAANLLNGNSGGMMGDLVASPEYADAIGTIESLITNQNLPPSDAVAQAMTLVAQAYPETDLTDLTRLMYTAYTTQG